jgi:hypothetical protein
MGIVVYGVSSSPSRIEWLSTDSLGRWKTVGGWFGTGRGWETADMLRRIVRDVVDRGCVGRASRIALRTHRGQIDIDIAAAITSQLPLSVDANLKFPKIFDLGKALENRRIDSESLGFLFESR